ncbi:hypothetical protein ATCC90586_002559 [Pythium insidiosum]|nr:hypothetical protein ATCC90586_002559 [Pythium insidiosum]
MSPTAQDKDYPTFNGNRDQFQGWRRRMELYLQKKGLLGYIAVSDYAHTRSFTYNGEEHGPLIEIKGKDGGPEPVTPSGDGSHDDDQHRKKKKKKKVTVDTQGDDETEKLQERCTRE